MKTKIAILISFLFSVNFSSAQLTIQSGLSDTATVSLLEGLGVSITNLTINCGLTSYGQFNGTSELAITDGFVMSTGDVSTLADSNDVGSTSNPMGLPGDSDLTVLSGMQTYDACVIEFDCMPTGDTLEFNFAFGSEEYPEFVGSSFNDVFAIFLSGPGISGTVNVAALPGGTIPVTTNYVNATSNSAYFYDNENPAGQYISLDGFTVNLKAFSVVVPSSTYHFKIALADAGDGIYDSGVFLEAFSFRSNGGNTSIINSALEKPQIKIFPNPASDHFTITSPNEFSRVRIMTITGELVKEFSPAEKFIRLTTENIPAGIYLVETITADNVSMNKLIVR